MAGELVSRTVEVFYNGVWHDITADAENEDTVTIRRGVDNEGGSAAAGTLNLTLNNGVSNVNPLVSSRYARGNATSDLYGLLPPNTPIRVSAGLAGGTQTVRMAGEIVALPPRADVSQRDLWTPVEAAGPLRRLGIPDSPLKSAPRRFATQRGAVGYWPLNDPAGARQGRPVIGGHPMRIRHGRVIAALDGNIRLLPVWSAADLAPWLGPAMQLERFRGEIATDTFVNNSPILDADIDTAGDELEWAVEYMFRGNPSNTPVTLQGGSPGDAADGNFTIVVGNNPSPDEIDVIAADDSTTVADYGSFPAPQLWSNEVLHHVRLQVQTEASGFAWLLFVDGELVAADSSVGLDLPQLRRVTLAGPFSPPGTRVLLGEVFAWAGTVPPIADDAVFGWRGERAGRRVERLCDEQGVAFTSTGDLDVTAPMGPQYPGGFLDLLGGCAKVEAAGSRAPILVEQRTGAGVHVNTLRSLYLPRTPDLTLDYAAANLSPPFDPTPDDFGLVNDATARRRDGDEVQVEVDGGPKGIDQSGRYDKADTFDAEIDFQLNGIAGWWSFHGTWDEDRYPTIRIDMRGLSTRTDGAALLAAAQALDPGALVEIVNPPAWLPQQAIQQMVLGITETISTEEWVLDLHTTPAGPFTAFILGDPVFGRLDTAGSELAIGVDATGTELLVATDSGKTRWMTDAERPAEFPFAAKLGGELVTVTAISGAVSPQTFTVTRSVNGISRAWPAGTRLRLARVAVAP